MPGNNEQTDAQSSQLRGTIENKAANPAGLLPKNTQQLVILGVTVVMVLIMWLTGGAKHTPKTTTAANSAAPVLAPDPAAVQDFKQTIQKEQAATRQPISPSDLARLEALGLAGDVPPGSAVLPPDGTAPAPGGVIGGSSEQAPPPDPVKEDKKKREYLSLFAPNVAFTYRSGPEREQMVGSEPNAAGNVTPSQQPTSPSPSADAQQPSEPLASVPPPMPAAPQQEKPAVAPTAHPNPDASTPGSFNSYAGKRYVVFEGTVLETLLINRLNGSFAGPVECLLTTDIYSHDRQHLLIPAGTKVLGEAKKVESLGQQRLAVYFHRLLMPDGYSVDLDQFGGLDQIGETALRDQVNNHYVQIFGASFAIGILGGIAEAGTGNVFTNSPLDQARAGLGSSLANSSMQILDRFLNILPTVTIREGHRVKIYLSGDLLVPDYTDHTMRPNF